MSPDFAASASNPAYFWELLVVDAVEAGVDVVPDEEALESAAGFDVDSAGLLELAPDALLGFALP